MTKNIINRRSFLKQCAYLNAAGYAGAYSALGGLSMTANAQSTVVRPSRYRALVCIYQTGGNDLNMLIPTDNDAYNAYKAIRGEGLSLLKSDDGSGREVFLPITSGSGANQKMFGLHPSCGIVDPALGAGSGGLKKLYDSNKLAFIANTGALLEPTTALEFKNNSVSLPPKLFGHLAQKDFVRAGVAYDGTTVNGWAGRIADLYFNGSGSPLNISFGGNNIWQRGTDTVAYGFSGSSVPQVHGYIANGDGGIEQVARRAALNDINQLEHEHKFVTEYGRIIDESFVLSDNLREGASIREIELTTEFPNTRLGAQLKNVAQLINARNGLQMPQQVFYVDSGGWDQHDNLLARHRITLKELSAAMAAFYEATVEMGLADDITTFTNGDFGRTLDPNSTGSDHAWGGNQVIMGGNVNGGQVFGEYPMFSPDDPQYREFRGTLVPSIATDQVSSTIAKWFGDFSDSTLRELFPNLAAFDSYDLGMLS
jgi:uncharacterized protein (DUF1501 family)